MIDILFTPPDPDHLRLLLLFFHWVMRRAIILCASYWKLWLLFSREFICVINELLHYRNFLFLNHCSYVYRIDDSLPENLFIALKLLFYATVWFLEGFGIEFFWWEIDRARFLPWLLDLVLFLHFLVLALLSTLLVHLFFASEFFLLLVNTLVDHFLLLKRFAIRCTKFDGSTRIAGSWTGIIDTPSRFVRFIQVHAWALYSWL